jgi:YesN/AraC family two-component response regulator
MKGIPNWICRVLVVDDEWLIADSLALILSKQGFLTKTAHSGERAIEIAKVFEPDLLISDVLMPGMTGIDTAEQILMFLPTCKIILLSGHATVDLLRRAKTRKYEILSKPVPPDVLLGCIAKFA